MKPIQTAIGVTGRGLSARSKRRGCFLLLLTAIAAGGPPRLPAASQVMVWDTGKRLAPSVDASRDAGWKAVPSELFAFEADPAKASSDPGYYGREYSFQGDAVVENQRLTAVFRSSSGRLVLYAKPGEAGNALSSDKNSLGAKVLELAARPSATQSGTLGRCAILRNAADEVVMAVSFAAGDSPEASMSAMSAVFTFGRDNIVEIKPGAKLTGLTVSGPIQYGVVPGFVGDDLLFGAGAYPGTDRLLLPVENVFVGLLGEGTSQLVMTWPKGKQELQLRLAGDPGGPRRIESIDFSPDAQSVYLAVTSAPGLWHREVLKAAHLEKDMPLSWKRPFPAKWKTQLPEAGVRTTFAFREHKGQIWRGVPGSYNYPAWFDGDNAFFHLSKKVPPKGEAVVYFLEGQDTPLSIATPVDLLKATLGRSASESILDATGRKLRTHHRRGGDGVHRACTCGCTEAIQAIFEAGQEVTRKDHVKEALSDMMYFVECHVERIEEYRRFADAIIPFLRAQMAAAPELKPFLENLEQTAQQIPQEYDVQKENMKSLAHAGELTRQTMALTGQRNTNNLSAYMDLLKAWRAMGGAQDYVVAQCHTVTRKLFQEAGYGCVQDAKAVAVAREVRTRCRQVLRNPDGYEIWADY